MNDPQQQPQQQHGQTIPHVQPQNAQRAVMQPAVTAPLVNTAATSATAVPATPAQPQEAVRIVFFCKDCYQLVDAQKIGRKYVYRCPTCHTKNVAFGTEKSIKSFYHVDDRKVEEKKPA